VTSKSNMSEDKMSKKWRKMSNSLDPSWQPPAGARCRVARWFDFKPKIQIWVHFGKSWNGRCWYILWTLGPFYGL
jgi:hypothetical protein